MSSELEGGGGGGTEGDGRSYVRGGGISVNSRHTLPQSVQEQLKSRPFPGAMTASWGGRGRGGDGGGRASAEDEIQVAGEAGRGAKRQATGDKKIGVARGKRERGSKKQKGRQNTGSACDAQLNWL